MKRIVIVEDDKLLADMYCHKLERAGLLVAVFGSAEEALPELVGDGADLLLLDVLLPGKNGLWLLKELRTAKVSLPVVILSNLAEADFAMPERLRAALGIVGYYVKTQVTPAEVLAAVQAEVS